MNFSFEKAVSNFMTKVAEVDKAVEFTASGVESASVARVLGLVADARTVSVEALEGEATYMGRVNFKLLYLDVEGEPKSLDYFADFTEKIKAEGVRAGVTLHGCINVLETDVTTDNELKLSAVVEITIFAVERKENECLIGTPDDCYVEKGTFEFPVLSGVKTFDVEASDEKAVGGDVSKVLLADTSAAVTEVRAGDGTVFVGGDFRATVSYFEGGQIKTAEFHIPFTEEQLLDGVSIGDNVLAYSVVKTTRVVLTGVEGDNVLRIESLVSVKVLAFALKTKEIVDDVFMLSNELDVERAECKCCALEKNSFVTDRFSASAMLAEARPAVRDIIGIISSHNSIAGVSRADGEVKIEGVVGATILYTDENGFNSVKAELPYAMAFKLDFPENAELRVSGAVEDITARVKRDREIEVTTKLGFNIEIWCDKTAVLLKSVKIGEEKEMNKSAVSVFIADANDTIWDASKALSATPKDIIEQNPEIADGIKAGDRLTFFRQLEMKF